MTDRVQSSLPTDEWRTSKSDLYWTENDESYETKGLFLVSQDSMTTIGDTLKMIY